MRTEEFAGGRHSLCRCSETTFSGGPSAAEVEACREASGGITHALLTAEDVEVWKRSYVPRPEVERIATRPEDWAAAARAILAERGAWRA